MYRHTPAHWIASSINLQLGQMPVEKQYGEMAGRRKWVIGWAEDDSPSGVSGCMCVDLQLWVDRIFQNAADASRYGCEGMMAIHFRTAAVAQ